MYIADYLPKLNIYLTEYLPKLVISYIAILITSLIQTLKTFAFQIFRINFKLNLKTNKKKFAKLGYTFSKFTKITIKSTF